MICIAHAESQPGSRTAAPSTQAHSSRLRTRVFRSAEGKPGLLVRGEPLLSAELAAVGRDWDHGNWRRRKNSHHDGCIVFFLLHDQRPWGNKKHHFHASRTHQHVLSGNMSLQMLWVTFLSWRYIVGRTVPWLRYEANPRGQARGSSCQRQLLQGPVTFPASPLLAGANGRVPSPVIAAKTTVVTVITGTAGFPMTTVANRKDSRRERDSRGLPPLC